MGGNSWGLHLCSFWRTLCDILFPSEKIRIDKLFLTPITTPPPRGKFITIHAFEEPGTCALKVRIKKKGTYCLGDENILVGQKESLAHTLLSLCSSNSTFDKHPENQSGLIENIQKKTKGYNSTPILYNLEKQQNVRKYISSSKHNQM